MTEELLGLRMQNFQEDKHVKILKFALVYL